MRSLILAFATLAFAAAASAAPSSAKGPYALDKNGRCRAANGVLVTAQLCHHPPDYPYCKPGKSKPCGKTCIPLDKVCQVKG